MYSQMNQERLVKEEAVVRSNALAKILQENVIIVWYEMYLMLVFRKLNIPSPTRKDLALESGGA